MSKGNRGNKEAKKPKQVKPAPMAPTTGGGTPTPPSSPKPALAKK